MLVMLSGRAMREPTGPRVVVAERDHPRVRLRSVSRVCLALGWLLLRASPTWASPTLYVRTSGNNGADGLTPATALRSIRVAARRLTDTGGEVIVGPGVYAERDISPRVSRPKQQRDASQPLSFIADRDGGRTGDLPGPVVVDATGNQTGFLLYGESYVLIDGFHVRGGSDAGIQVRYNRGAKIFSSNVTITNCVVYGNGKRGIDIQDTDNAVVFDNLVYGNGATGISVAGDLQGSADAVVANNTSAGNGLYGILIGQGDLHQVPSRNAFVLSNVISGNALAGIKVLPPSQPGYGSAFNVNGDGYHPAALAGVALGVDPTDAWADPRLVHADCVTVDPSSCADEDFRLRPDSPAIDYGPATVDEVGISGSTRADGLPDTGIVDAGYHFGNTLNQFTVPSIALVPIFVRTTGDDNNDGSTPARALRTIGAAAARVRAGNRVVVGAGVYHEGNINVGPRFGSTYRPIEFFADDGTMTGDAGRVVLDATGTGQDKGFDILGTAHVTIDGFYVTGTLHGIQIRARRLAGGLKCPEERPVDPKARGPIRPEGICGADNATVRNCVVFSAQNGIVVRDSSAATIFNNLVYANQTVGIAVGGSERGSPDARVINNTVYRNGVNGIFIGDHIVGETVGSQRAVVMNNLLAGHSGHNLFVTTLSAPGYVGAANLDDALVGDLGFVDPAGPDGILGGSGFAADDFHLRQVPAGQNATSVAVGRGVAPAAVMGLDAGSTRTDGKPDTAVADVGFHYPSANGDRPREKTITSLQGMVAPVVPGRLLFVSPNGDNRNDGVSPATALASIRVAGRAANPGDQIIVAPGRYAEGDINLAHPGTSLRPISFLADSTGALSGTAPGPVLIDPAGAYDTGFILLKRSFVQIRGFYIRGARETAIQVRKCAGVGNHCDLIERALGDVGSDHVTIADNVIFSGHRGIDITDSSDAVIINNLIYANDSVGISIMGERRAAANAQVINNTLYQNGGDGILLGPIGGSSFVESPGSPGATVINNIIQGSGLNCFGIKTGLRSRPGLVISHNINRDGTNGALVDLEGGRHVVWAPRDLFDPGRAPEFADPAGPDGILGGDGFLDDNFRLNVGSPAIDAGAQMATDLALSAQVARADGQQDVGPVDLGFHYNVPGPLGGISTPVATLYVRAAAGDDSNDGQSPGLALRTLSAAARRATAGTSIVIGPGTYTEGNVEPAEGGSHEHPVVFVADPSGVQTGDAPGPVLLDASGHALGIRLSGRAYVRLDGLAITGAQQAAVWADHATGVEVTNCRLFSNPGTGVVFRSAYLANTLFNNVIYANGDDGVDVQTNSLPSSVRLIANTVYGNVSRERRPGRRPVAIHPRT